MTTPGTAMMNAQEEVEPTALLALMDTMLDAGGSEHPMTNLPFTVSIDGRLFNGQGLSLTSATVTGLAASTIGENDRLATFSFPFGGYAISLVAEVRITKTKEETSEYRLEFTQPTGQHLPTLRYILNSYISGDIVSLGSIISQREKVAAPSAAKTTPKLSLRDRLQILARLVMTIVMTVLLVIIFSSLVYDRLFTSRVKELAVFTQGGEALRAVESGQINYLNDQAREGEVVYKLRTAEQGLVEVVNPCACRINISGVALGTTVMAGEPVAEVIRPNAVNSVLVNMTSDEARRILTGDAAELTFPSGSVLLDREHMTVSRLTNTDKVRATFKLYYNFPDLTSGTPVSIRIVNGTFASIQKRLVKMGVVQPPHRFVEREEIVEPVRRFTQQEQVAEPQQQLFEQQVQQELGNETGLSINSERWGRDPVVAPVQN